MGNAFFLLKVTSGTLENGRLPQSLRSFAMTEGALRSEFYAIEPLL